LSRPLRPTRNRRYLHPYRHPASTAARHHASASITCPQCGGHFEARKYPFRGNPGSVYICSTRRRKPGIRSNTLALPITETDDDVLGIVEGEVLGTRFIEELLALVDDGHQHEAAHLEADRDRLQREISNLLDLAASGVPADTIAPKIREWHTALARVESQLRIPRQPRPNIEKLRAALPSERKNGRQI
jgi:hypothetical protein